MALPPIKGRSISCACMQIDKMHCHVGLDCDQMSPLSRRAERDMGRDDASHGGGANQQGQALQDMS